MNLHNLLSSSFNLCVYSKKNIAGYAAHMDGTSHAADGQTANEETQTTTDTLSKNKGCL